MRLRRQAAELPHVTTVRPRTTCARGACSRRRSHLHLQLQQVHPAPQYPRPHLPAPPAVPGTGERSECGGTGGWALGGECRCGPTLQTDVPRGAERKADGTVVGRVKSEQVPNDEPLAGCDSATSTPALSAAPPRNRTPAQLSGGRSGAGREFGLEVARIRAGLGTFRCKCGDGG
jgi:hypothetical protein